MKFPKKVAAVWRELIRQNAEQNTEPYRQQTALAVSEAEMEEPHLQPLALQRRNQ